MANLSKFERLAAFAAIVIIAAGTLSLLTPTPLLILSLGLMVAGIFFIILGLVFGFESFFHYRRQHEGVVVDRSGRVHYLLGATRRVTEQKHREPTHRRLRQDDVKAVIIICLLGVAFIAASVIISVLFLL